MNVERTISARRVEVKPSPSSLSATVTATAPRVVTLHERFSQLPKVEPKRAEVADLNLFQEAGIRSRRQATEQRQSTQREIAVAARRSISTTWTPSFDDDNDNSCRARVSVGDRRGRQFEFDQPREPAFVIKGIPPPQPSSKQQRAVMVQHQQQTVTTRSAPRGGRSTVTRGGRVVAALPPATRGNNNSNSQRIVNARGGRASRGAGVAAPGNNQRRAPVTAVGARGGRGGAAVRGGGAGRGGARGGRAAAAKPASKDVLDAELDSYMLQTPESAKSYLDQQLEDYMHAREQESSASSSSS